MGDRILALLRSTNQEGASPCRLITVALSRARSAAADLLSAGDYAIAHPGSKLLYHGTRIPFPVPVTAESASLLTDVLKGSNHRLAAALLDKSAERFMFLLSALRTGFEACRANENDRILTDLDCFREMLCQRTSLSAEKALRQAATIWRRCYGLLIRFEEEVAKAGLSRETAATEKIMLDASIAFEYEENATNPEWSLRTGGLSKINDHFFFLEAYSRGANGVRFATLCERWAPLVVAKDDHDVLSAEEDAERFREYFLPFWSFFIALCRALQQSENELTAMDAFWLGLVDTVRDIAAPAVS